MTLTAMILATFMGEGLLKHIIMRPRPYTDFPYVQLLIEKSTPYSFPSAHTTFSFSAAYVLSAYVKKYSIVFWSTAVAISLSRLYLFMHYPTDVVAGIVLGLLCGKAVVTLFQRKFEKSARGTFPLA